MDRTVRQALTLIQPLPRRPRSCRSSRPARPGRPHSRPRRAARMSSAGAGRSTRRACPSRPSCGARASGARRWRARARAPRPGRRHRTRRPRSTWRPRNLPPTMQTLPQRAPWMAVLPYPRRTAQVLRPVRLRSRPNAPAARQRSGRRPRRRPTREAVAARPQPRQCGAPRLMQTACRSP